MASALAFLLFLFTVTDGWSWWHGKSPKHRYGDNSLKLDRSISNHDILMVSHGDRVISMVAGGKSKKRSSKYGKNKNILSNYIKPSEIPKVFSHLLLLTHLLTPCTAEGEGGEDVSI